MGSLGNEDLDEENGLHHGCFPLSNKRSTKNNESLSIIIFGFEALEKLEWSRDRKFGDIANISWALLLRVYLRTDFVSFGLIRPGKPVVAVAHYHLSKYERFDDVFHTELGEQWNAHHAHVNINTAVNHMTASFLGNGAEDIVEQSQTTNSDQYCLVLNVFTDRPEIRMTYSCPMISETYARAVACTYEEIFTAVCYGGDLKISDLNGVSAADYRAMTLWNPQNPFASEEYRCMHRLVEAKTRETPDAQAICAWDGSLTYLELDSLASFAAQRLVHAGVCPGVYVPFACEKSKWAVVATLAVLKAGGAFVPVNPEDPTSRLADILSKVNADVVVTMDTHVSKFETLVTTVVVVSERLFAGDEAYRTVTNGRRLQNNADSHVTELDDNPSKFTLPNGMNSTPTREVRPDDPMVVLFTSGSTGQPKGIVLEHSAICTHALIHGTKMHYHGARVLQFAAHTFDVAIMDFFTTLLFGGCICIPSEEERRTDIVGVINNMRVDYALLTPSFAGLIDPLEVPTLKTLAIGGEALPQDRVQRWSERVRLIQVYGPAEVGICLSMDMTIDTAPETVGFPLCNSSCWLVDPDDPDALVPIGAVGELMIAGPSLARGYLHNEAKTRTSFIDKPKWASKLGLHCDRFYLSGDLLRYNTNSLDGSFDIIGRKDAQIKLRGQRIEPAEIEYHIGKINGVAVSMVTRPYQGPFADELVCVVQMHWTDSKASRVRNEPMHLAKSQSLTAEILRDYLAKILPRFMIPSVCLTIETMPLVPSLKIDRRRVSDWLRTLETDLGRNDIGQISPLLPNEYTALALSQSISSIMSATNEKRRSSLSGFDLRLQSVGINSIQIISLSMYLQRHHSVKLPMDTLLSPDLTIRRLAKLVDVLKHSNSNMTNGNDDNRSFLGEISPRLDFKHEIHKRTEELLSSFQQMEGHIPNIQHAMPQQCNIFLTGATGYLGSIVLLHLLKQPHITAFLLVRCASTEEGLDRIIAAATAYKWWHPSFKDRIRVWCGDLTKPNLGLEPDSLMSLEGSGVMSSQGSAIHGVIHNGARVHYSSSYASLFPTNVTPTLELLRIILKSTHISDFVFVSGGLKPNAPLLTCESSQISEDLMDEAGGYAQTKCVSENLVHACNPHAAFQGKNLQIIKPGYIMGSKTTGGAANTGDFIWRLVAGCVEIGAFNAEEADHWLFISDVDEVAEGVLTALLPRADKDIEGRTTYDASVSEPNTASSTAPSIQTNRILSGLRFSDLWALLQERFSYPLQGLSHHEWITKLKSKIMEKQDQHLLFPLIHVLEKDGNNIGEKISPTMGIAGDGNEVGTQQMQEPNDTSRVLRAVEENVRFLIGKGILPALQ